MQKSARLSDKISEVAALVTDFANKVLLTQTHPNTIRIARGAISLWILFNCFLLLPAGSHFWSYESYIPLANVTETSLWGKATNLLSFEQVSQFYPAFVIGQIVMAILAGLSVSPRLSSALLYFFTINLDNRAMVTMDGGNNLMHILLFLLIFMAPGSGKQTSGWRADAQMFGNAVSNAAFFMARVQVALVYATAGLLKVKGALWPKGVALYYTMNVVEYGNEMVGQVMSDWPLLLVFSCYMTVLFQVSFPILIWPRLTRPLMMLIGTIFHVSIIFVMGLTTFGLAMCTSYIFFYTDEKAAKLLRALRPKSKVYAAFDKNCVVCQKFARLVRLLDWRSLVLQGSAQAPDDVRILNVPIYNRLTELHACDNEGVVKGFDAIVLICSRLPILLPVLPLLKLIGYLGLGDMIYKQIAENSGWRRECKAGVCQLS